jgi:hypothetical protein
VLAAATDEAESLQLAPTAVNIPVVNAATAVTEENLKPDMALDVILDSSASPITNAMSSETAADIGAQYIWDMFGESIDGKTVHMVYYAHPAFTRTIWFGTVLESGTFIALERDTSIEDRIRLHNSTLFTFSLDAVTGERIDISTNSHWVETSEEVRAALDERLSRSQGGLTEGMIAERELYFFSQNSELLNEYAEAAWEFAQVHFNTTEVVGVELININPIAFDINENGLFTANRQLVFEVTDCTGRIADMAITEATKELIWLNTSSNDIVPGWNYGDTENDRG